jgi:hypothetical protein
LKKWNVNIPSCHSLLIYLNILTVLTVMKILLYRLQLQIFWRWLTVNRSCKLGQLGAQFLFLLVCLFLFSTCFRQLSVWMTVWYAGCTLHTRQLSIQNNKYQVSHKYSCFSWWWAHSRPKHVEKRNKHTKKNCAPSWLYLQDYTGMCGQQNVKKPVNRCLWVWFSSKVR